MKSIAKKGMVLAAGLAVAGAFTSSAFAQNVTWNLSMWGKKRAFTAGLEAISEQVANQTGGKFKIKIHYGGALSKPKENLDGIKLGAFQMAAFCASYHPGKTPTLGALDLPFLPFGNLDIQQAVHEAFYKHPAVVKDMEKWNARILMTSLLPQYEVMGRGDAPMTLESWKGRRVRALGGIAKAMAAVGAVPTSVPAPETYKLLESGAVDGVTWPFSYAHVAFKVHEVSTWFTSNLAPGTVTCPVVYNIKAFDKLPTDYKVALVNARFSGYAALKAAYGAADEKNLPMLRKKLKEIVYSDADLAKFREVAAQPVWDAWIAENKDTIPAQELFDLIMAEAKTASQ